MTAVEVPVGVPETPVVSIGFVGLGAMGAPMAARLVAAGHPTIVRDIDPEAVNRLVVAGGDVRGGTRAEVAAAEVIVLMLPDSRAVRAEIRGQAGSAEDRATARGLLADLQPGSVVVDMSSSDPEVTRELAADVAGAGATLLDAPVSGGVGGARSGTLAIMVGGDEAALTRVRPVLAHLGDRITHVGGSGAGHAVKALNNLLSAIGLVGAAEVLLTATRFGVEPAVALEVLNGSTGRNNSTERKFAQYVLSRRFDAGFAAALMVKDLGTAVGLAGSTGVDMPVGRAVLAVCADAVAELPPGADHTAVVRHLEQAAGVTLADADHR